MEANPTNIATRPDTGVRPASARQAIEECGLDEPVRQLIAKVVKRVGGTRRERCDVALELIAHFADARTAGQSGSESIAAFGDVRTAAKLLRRAVFRKRGALAQGWWWTTRAIAACIAGVVGLYGLLAVRFFLGAPSITVDSVAALRALVRPASSEEQAWPLYREAMSNLKRFEIGGWYATGDRGKGIGPLESDDASSVAWSQANDALARQSADLDRLRRAAMLPSLGIEYGTLSAEDRVFFGLIGDPGASSDPVWGGSTLTIVLPYLGELRRASRWLSCDARHAVAEGKASRAVDDIEAIMGIAKQLRRPVLIDQMFGFAVLSLALDTTQKLLAEVPQAFTPADLERLAALLDGVRATSIHIDFTGERIGAADVLQRLYTDDGNGDGRLASTALEQGPLYTTLGLRPPPSGALQSALGPAFSLAAPSRRELCEQIERQIAAAEELQRKPLWNWSRHDYEAIVLDRAPRSRLLHIAGLDGLSGELAGVAALRLLPALELRLDATRLAVALVRQHQRSGAWPASLAELDPSFLRSPALDVFDGKPLRYALRQGQPVIWTIGPDRTDDQLSSVLLQRWAATVDLWPSQVDAAGRPWPRGDLILWPPQQEEEAPAGEPVPVGP